MKKLFILLIIFSLNWGCATAMREYNQAFEQLYEAQMAAEKIDDFKLSLIKTILADEEGYLSLKYKAIYKRIDPLLEAKRQRVLTDSEQGILLGLKAKLMVYIFEDNIPRVINLLKMLEIL